MDELILDFSEFMSMKEAHLYIAEKMGFSESYGMNLDALYDCLTEMSKKVRVRIRGCDMLDHFDNSIVNVFWDAQAENDALEIKVERRIKE